MLGGHGVLHHVGHLLGGAQGGQVQASHIRVGTVEGDVVSVRLSLHYQPVLVAVFIDDILHGTLYLVPVPRQEELVLRHQVLAVHPEDDACMAVYQDAMFPVT